MMDAQMRAELTKALEQRYEYIEGKFKFEYLLLMASGLRRSSGDLHRAGWQMLLQNRSGDYSPDITEWLAKRAGFLTEEGELTRDGERIVSGEFHEAELENRAHFNWDPKLVK